MTSALFNNRRGFALAAVSMLLAGPAWAERDGQPPWEDQQGRHDQRGTDKHGADPRGRHEHARSQGRQEVQRSAQRHFDQRHHPIVREHYQRESHAGRHPPGWANRHDRRYDHWQHRHHGHTNQHGHFKPWRMGYPLHHTVVYYEVPVQIVHRLGPPPRGHRYVQVAGDILLIAIGTTLVVDALEDLVDWR